MSALHLDLARLMGFPGRKVNTIRTRILSNQVCGEKWILCFVCKMPIRLLHSQKFNASPFQGQIENSCWEGEAQQLRARCFATVSSGQGNCQTECILES